MIINMITLKTTINDINYTASFSLDKILSLTSPYLGGSVSLMAPAPNCRSRTWTRIPHILLDIGIGPEMGLRLKQNHSVSSGEEVNFTFGFMASNDVNTGLPIVLSTT